MSDSIFNVESLARHIAKELRDEGLVVPRLLDLKQAASYLGLRTPDALRAKAKRGQITYVEIDSNLRFDKQDLDRWIESSKIRAAA